MSRAIYEHAYRWAFVGNRNKWIENQEAKIIGIEILYDGITHIEGEDYGYWFEDDELYGYPAPVVRFHLNQEVDVEQFRTSIFTTSYKLTTKSIEENDDEPFFAEDHNGWHCCINTNNWLIFNKNT